MTPYVGQTAQLSRTVGDNDIALFTEISGDRNPLHYDEAAARASRFGEIVVDAKGATNIPGVFAAGDVTTVPYKQIVIAMGEGSKASLSAFDHLIRHS